jgi:hypothetical protein
MSRLGVRRTKRSMVVEEELRQEAKKVERSSLHSAWVHETSVQDDANLGGAVEECEIDRVAWPVHQKILG